MRNGTRRRAAVPAILIATFALSCGRASDGGSPPKDPALDQKLERLLALIVDVESRGAGDDDSAAVEAMRLITEFGGPDSTAKVLAERLLRNADRWIPVLDSLGRTPATSATPGASRAVHAPPGA